MSKIIPINDFVIVKEEAKKDKVLASGIIIPEQAQADPVGKYDVTAVSASCKVIKENDAVVFPDRMATQFSIDGVVFKAVNERNIMCKIEE